MQSHEFDTLFPEGVKVEKVASGFEFTEGPVWHPDGYLLFSDIPPGIVYKWKAGSKAEVYREPSGNSNGLTFDKQFRLIACEHGNRRVSRTERGGSISTLASHYQGKRLNSPNDAVVRSDGSIYFTDPPYGVEDKDREMRFQGVYRIPAKGDIELLVDDFDRPNGLAFSPDERTLYIADTTRMHIRAFDVKADGSLSNGRVFAEMKSDEPGAPDGMRVDLLGNVWCTGSGGVWVFDKHGKHLGVVRCPEVPANCAWGDQDGKTLYITARTGLYRVSTTVEGKRPHVPRRTKQD